MRVRSGVAALVAVGCLAASNAAAFPTMSGTCSTSGIMAALNAMGGRSSLSGDDARVVAQVDAPFYVPGEPIMISIVPTSMLAGTINGVLMYVENQAGDRIGLFDVSGTNLLQPLTSCPGADGATITHTIDLSPTGVATLSVPWTAPDEDVGPIVVRLIAYESIDLLFNVPTPLVVQSSVLFASDFES